MEMSRDNVIKLSLAGALLLVAIAVIFFTLFSGPRVVVNEEVPNPDIGTAGGTRGPSGDF